MTLYPHQETLLHTLSERDAYGIFWEQRTGKTMPTLLDATNRIMSGDAKDCLIVAPKSAIGAWKRDMGEFRGERKKACKKIHLVNYELVWRRAEYDRPFDIVILDECHKIAHRTSKQSKFLLTFATRSKYRRILSGTPMGQGRLEDLYTEMEFLQKGFFGKYSKFQERYCKMKTLRGSYVTIVVGYRNKEELLERVGTMVSSLRFKDISNVIPDPPDNIVYCDPTEKKIAKQIKDNYVEEFDIVIPNPVVQMMKFRQVASGFILDEKHVAHNIKGTKAKETMFSDLLGTILPEKVVIFAEFKESIKRIEKVVCSYGVRYLVLNGEQQDKECWRRFQSDDDMTVIICQYASANAGIDLWTANHMIFYEPSLSTTMTEQSRARIKIKDKPKACAYHWLITADSIEEKIYHQLQKKQDFTLDNLKAWAL
jgi:SNF2 family DNA or RNA helicase